MTSMASDERVAREAGVFDARPISDVESLFLLDREGHITAAGPRAEVLLRRRASELVGDLLERFLDGWPGLAEALRRDERLPAVVRRASDAVSVTVEVQPLPIAYDGVRRFTVCVRRADVALTTEGPSSEALYVTEALPDGRLRTLHLSPSLASFLGQGDDPSLGALLRRVHRADLARVGVFQSAAARGEPGEVRYRLVLEDGMQRDVLERTWCHRQPDGSVIAFGLLTDITSRALVRTRGDEARLIADIVDALGDAPWRGIVDESGAIQVTVARSLEPLLGGQFPPGARHEVIWDASVHPEDRDRYEAHKSALIAGGVHEVEYRLIGLDGRTRWVHGRGSSRLIGGRVQIDGILSDVTHRHLPSEEAEGVSLTRRQCEILRMLAEGVPSAEIARRLGLVPVTVKNHVAAIHRALGSHTRLEAVAKARRLNLI
jgi:DNA-binding CsgD family transcriptional regulator/PAS domain-containing protein